MRRRDCEISEVRLMEKILQKAQVCRIGLIDEGVPYVVPVHFGYRDGRLYFHSAAEGKKLDLIRARPEVGFEVDIMVEMVAKASPCNWSTRYASVIGVGNAVLLAEPQAKRRAMEIIFAHYSPRPPLFSDHDLEQVAVVEITVSRMTGKAKIDVERELP